MVTVAHLRKKRRAKRIVTEMSGLVLKGVHHNDDRDPGYYGRFYELVQWLTENVGVHGVDYWYVTKGMQLENFEIIFKDPEIALLAVLKWG